MNNSEVVYLDYAGAAPSTPQLLSHVFENISELQLGNPHSHNACGRMTSDLIDSARCKILTYFGTNPEEYSVIFTSGCTRALQIVAECFDYGPQSGAGASKLVYTQDSHTSVVGMRESAKIKGVQWQCLSDQQSNLIFKGQGQCTDGETTNGNSLFVYPLQSNFCGRKYPKEWCAKVHSGILNRDSHKCRWFVCIDAAAYVCRNRLNLSSVHPDFVALSFYKIFGYPTGLGCLLVKNTSACMLKKFYFGGGTVELALSNVDFKSDRKLPSERFEDGTVDYFGIVSLLYCFDYFENDVINYEDPFTLTQVLYEGMQTMKHHNGTDVCTVYSYSNYTDSSLQGATLAFNLLKDDKSFVGYSQVEQMADLYNIQLRTGCLCNLGACQHYLQLENQYMLDNFKSGKVCGDELDLINGQPLGCVRVSLGRGSTKTHVEAMLAMVYDCFCTKPSISWNNLMDYLNFNQNVGHGHSIIMDDASEETGSPSLTHATISHLFIYPIKSCKPFPVDDWPLSSTGLLYDRHWMVVNKEGVCLTQKRCPSLTFISPTVDILNNKLKISANHHQQSIILHIEDDHTGPGQLTPDEHDECFVKLCMDRVSAVNCGSTVNDWLASILHLPSPKLVRQNNKSREDQINLSLVNEAQVLLVNRASIKKILELVKKMEPAMTELSLINRFRPNIVIDGPPPFSEEKWKNIKIGGAQFEVVSKCRRCQMICIDQDTGIKNPEIMKCLRDTKPTNQMTFGIYLRQIVYSQETIRLNVGNTALIDLE